MTQRTNRVDELLQQEIGAILSREIADPRIGFVTVTEVETTPDLRHARVWVSIIGQAGEREEALRALGHAVPFIRRQLGARLRIRRIPELHVRLDDSLERGTRVMHLIEDLEAGREPGDEPIGESLPTPVARIPPPDETASEPDAGFGPPAARSKGTRKPRRSQTGRGARGAPTSRRTKR
jgi:ribosome-binding factor A